MMIECCSIRDGWKSIDKYKQIGIHGNLTRHISAGEYKHVHLAVVFPSQLIGARADKHLCHLTTVKSQMLGRRPCHCREVTSPGGSLVRVDLLSKLLASVHLPHWTLGRSQRLSTSFTGDFCGAVGLLEVTSEVLCDPQQCVLM